MQHSDYGSTKHTGSNEESESQNNGGWEPFDNPISGDPIPSQPPEIVLNRWTQCYLEDASSTCPVCWITSGKDGSVQFGGCPPEIRIEWDRVPPEHMYDGESYEVAYTVRVAREVRRGIIKQNNFHLPHVNVHSCLPASGACTPFIQNTPGLATHTDALEADFRADGTARFKSVINLPENRYTMIAHARFFVPDPSCPAGATSQDCLNKIDMAIGEQRTITKAPPKTASNGGTGIWERDGSASVAVVPSGPPSRCYLDTISGDEEAQDTLCPVCWETPTDSPSIKAKIVHCPPGFELEWTQAPPNQLSQEEDYDVSYRVKIGNRLDQLEAVQGFDIAHSNIHSCFASVEECTPSIANTPGLATHTNAEKSNVNRGGEAEFTSKISQLPPGEYTVIAHVRFFLKKGSNSSGSGRSSNPWAAGSGGTNGGVTDGLMQYDAAIGLRPTVLSASGPPSRCYLDTISGDEEAEDTLCPVCWETPTDSPSIKAKIVHCPPGLELEWTQAPPKQLLQEEDNDVSYRVKIGNRLD